MMKKIIICLSVFSVLMSANPQIQYGSMSKSSNNNVKKSSSFKCDGRIYCSQMKSCEEAIYFLKHCPNTKMDGKSKNGIPCERQWCGKYKK